MLQLTCTALYKDREVCLVMFYEGHVETSTVFYFNNCFTVI